MLRLEFPNESHKTMWEEMIEEWSKYEPLPTSPWILFYGKNYEEFLKNVQNASEGKEKVKIHSSLYFGIFNKKLVGGIDIRHNIELPELRDFYGHIGYGIRPNERKKGYATEMLTLGLQEAKKLGIQKILISSDDDNIASIKVIEKNGGIFEKHVQNEQEYLRKYWIQL